VGRPRQPRAESGESPANADADRLYRFDQPNSARGCLITRRGIDVHARAVARFVLILTSGVTLSWLASELLSKAPVLAAQKPPTAKPSTERKLQLPATPYNYGGIELPLHFQEQNAQRFDNTPQDNQTTNAGATLGRVLFYDTRISANNTVACGSCHVQKYAFVDPNRGSRGFRGGTTDRHAMNLVNLRYDPRARFFWDERGGNLESMVLMPAENHLEMGQDLAKLPAVLTRDPAYAPLFTAAFGDPTITTDRISRALAQFLRSMVSYQSKYDEGRARVKSASEDFANYTQQENRGKALFLRNCGLCHLPNNQEAHFIMVEPVNTGLDEDTEHTDGGVGDITLNPKDIGRFKSPTLRNVEVTAPYMHDGRFPTLDAVIDHYSSGGKNHPNKDVRIQAMHFTNSEKAAIIAFLKTLTDQKFLTDPKFSDPFQ
jgi:cytochrome c peroxidase